MTLGIISVLICAILHASSNIIDAHLTNNIFKKIPTILFYCGITNVLVLPFLFFFGSPVFPSWSIMHFVVLAGIIEIAYLVPYYLALRSTDTSIVCAFFSLGKIIVPFMAYVLVKEQLHTSQYVGFAIIIISSIVLSIDDPKKIKINKGFYLMLLSSFILASQSVFFKAAMEELDWVSCLFYSMLISTIVVAMVWFWKPYRSDLISGFKVYIKNAKIFLLNESVFQLGNIAIVFSISVLPVVVVDGISSTQPIFALLLGFILYKFFGDKFKEDVSTEGIIKKMICFIFIIIGVVLTVGI
ncbi:MAG: EamA family transporter [Lactobacillus sp.]|jgi:drug/metabolite transporter (DMT)-like permease|nr:EamA family transporter [Lactobacillus sp.]